MSQSAKLSAAIASMQVNQGLYFCVDPKAPTEWMVPLVSMGGKIYAMKLDQELRPDRFVPGVRIVGPFTPESKIIT